MITSVATDLFERGDGLHTGKIQKKYRCRNLHFYQQNCMTILIPSVERIIHTENQSNSPVDHIIEQPKKFQLSITIFIHKIEKNNMIPYRSNIKEANFYMDQVGRVRQEDTLWEGEARLTQFIHLQEEKDSLLDTVKGFLAWCSSLLPDGERWKSPCTQKNDPGRDQERQPREEVFLPGRGQARRRRTKFSSSTH